MTTTTAAKKAPKKKPRRPQGEGSIIKRKDGSYQASIELPAGPGGKRRRKYVYGPSKAEVVRKLNFEKAELDRRGDLASSHPTVAQWCDRYLRDLFQGRPGSIRNYRNAIENYIKPSIGGIKLDKLTPDDVIRFHNYMRDVAGLSGTSRYSMHGILRAIIAVAVRHDKVWRNVVTYVDPPKKDTKKFTAWTADEAKQFLQYLDDQKVPNRARFVFALLTGARAGECLGLRWKDVDWDAGTITIQQQLQRITNQHGCERTEGGAPTCGYAQAAKCPRAYFDAPTYWQHEKLTPTLYLAPVKTKAGERVIPLIPALRAILLWHREETKSWPNPHGLVFTSPPRKWGGVDPDPRNALTWRPQTDAELRVYAADGSPTDPTRDGAMWKQLAKGAGVPEMRRHDARHTAITLLLDMGIPAVIVKEIVGHTTVDMTESYKAASLPPAVDALVKLSSIVPESMLAAAGLVPEPEQPALAA